MSDQTNASVLALVSFAVGKWVAHWAQTDELGLLQQLGAIPAPGEGGE